MQTEAPIITTIIPTYRRPLLLRRAIRSVLAQTYPHLRVCVYDNASGDETAAVVAELARDDARLHYHCHAENIGASANTIYGMQQAETPYFAVLSDDDYYLPTFFATVMAGFDDHPDAVCSGGDTIFVTERGRIMRHSSAKGYFVPPESILEYTAGNYPVFPGFVFRTEVMAQIGGIDAATLHGDVDFDFLWKVFSRFPHVISSAPCVIYVAHKQQLSRRVDLDLYLRAYQFVYDDLAANEIIPPESRARACEETNARFASSFFAIGLLAIADRDHARARQAADILRIQFHMARRAMLLEALDTVCKGSKVFSWLLDRAIVSLRDAMLSLRARKYAALRAEVQAYLPAP